MAKLAMRGAVVALAFAAAACSTPVPQALQTRDIPSGFDGPIPSGTGVWPQKDWWGGFGSPELNDLITEAQANNLNIANAFANVLQASAQANIQRSSLFPSITLAPSAIRQKTAAGYVSEGGQTVYSPSVTYNEFGLEAQASYQADFWGQAQDNLRAAEEILKAQRFAQEVVTLTTVADVGTTYLDILALREEIAITKQNVEDTKQVLQVTQNKQKNGISSILDVAQEQALVDQQEANMFVLHEQEHAARVALAILLGRKPEGFDVKARNLDVIQTPLVAPGLPSDLLLRRPDIAEAEANLASAHANVDAARAAFFPAVSLNGAIGTGGTAIGTLFQASTFEWSLGAQALQTLFDAGKLFAESDMAKAQQLGLVATYRNAVISAFGNVETSLVQVSDYAGEQDALGRDVKESATAFHVSDLQYREGIIDITSVIQTQQALFTAQIAFVQAKLAHAQAVIGLYQALGGGWQENPGAVTQHLPGTVEAVAAPVPNPDDSMWKAIGSAMP